MDAIWRARNEVVHGGAAPNPEAILLKCGSKVSEFQAIKCGVSFRERPQIIWTPLIWMDKNQYLCRFLQGVWLLLELWL